MISGAFSMSRQAVRLGFLPRLTIRHTSGRESGQVYLPAVNWLLFGGVLVLIAVFESSQRLATAYGLAVTGTLLLTTSLFLTYAATAWHRTRWKLATVAVVIGGLELTYLGANLTKVVSGGWLPLLIAAVVVTPSSRCCRRTCRTSPSSNASPPSSSGTPTTASSTCRPGSASTTSRTSPSCWTARTLVPELGDGGPASYYLSRMRIERGSPPGMSTWRTRLFIGLAHNAANPADDFHLPTDRTVVMGSRIEL